ncbi:hypothetical protein ACSFBM_01590 [Variovorax sp. GB1R11]|uniref:hypothetical protein n=1 Tax=Variovorax sp. GB1R11 TaxID=3443741 RepID=UPI003F456854
MSINQPRENLSFIQRRNASKKLAFGVLGCFCIFINIQEYLLSSLKLGGGVGYVDEAFLLVPYVLAAGLLSRKRNGWMLGVLLFPFVSIIYGVLVNGFSYSNIRFANVAVQSFISAKLFLYSLIFFYALKIAGKDSNFFETILRICLIVSLVGVVFNIINPAGFIYSDFAYELERNRLVGFQFKPNDLSILAAFSFIFFLLKRKKSMFDKLLFVAVAMIVGFGGSRTALLIVLIALGGYLIAFGSYKVFIPGFLLAVLAVLIGWNYLANSFFFQETLRNFSEFESIDQSQYIRFIMVYYGAYLSAINFPVGVGPANFGTVLSANSPVYEQLGLSGSRFFQELAGIYDSNIASVLGEYGFLGVLTFGYFSKKIVGNFSFNPRLKFFLFVAVVIVVSFSQPFFAYQVNSINFLLVIFSLVQDERIFISKARANELRTSP